jgi:ribosomal-protein-alanine N-acetyltransferase
MTLADIPAVVAIEHASYSMTWPANAYDYELQKNEFAHYFVLRTFLPHSLAEPSTLIGLGGFWLMADEAHISTIAIHPDWRGLGLGEWLLLYLLEVGQNLGAQFATLEVRPSNHDALSLYHKYQFEQVGRRRHYYSDNNEDALILTTPPLNAPDYQAMLTQRQTALYQRLAKLQMDKTGRVSYTR